MTVIVASMCIVCALLFLFLGNTEALALMRSELRVATSPSVQTKTSPSDRVHSCLLLYRGLTGIRDLMLACSRPDRTMYQW